MSNITILATLSGSCFQSR